MTDRHRFSLAVRILLGGLAVTGCGRMGTINTASRPETVIGPTSPPATLATEAPLPTSTTTVVIPDTGWERLRAGLERRTIHLFSDDGEPFEHLLILRLDPDGFQFDVAYHPQPQPLEAWQEETDALIVLNGGYFRLAEGTPVPNGLTVVDGEAMGSSYGDFGGMFAVTANGPELRWLTQAPYDPNEPLLAALQSFPVLVKPGGELGFPQEAEDNRAARRSVIGMDREGRVIFIVASVGNFTLHRLSAYLVASDFDLDIAINLDGGPSSGILLADPFEEISSLAPLPIVITVRQR
jgi:uncharacterized protein YigE (DUF2233 family)